MSQPVWIDTTPALEQLVRTLGAGPLTLDTEADSFHHYRDKVCLVQLAAGGTTALVDPLATIDLRALAEPLGDAALPKLMHGADYDVRILHRDFGFVVLNLFDTMIAARLAGERMLGLAALLQTHLGVTLDKSQQRADWSKRPLTARMREYAVDDVRHLPELAERLTERLASLGRAGWAREECERLVAVRWRDRRAEDPEPFRRIKGTAGQPPRTLAVVRELWDWRDGVAQRRDRPAFRVLRDEALIAIATALPATNGDLAAVPGIPEALVRSPVAADLIAAIARGVACPDDELPAPKDRSRPAPDPAVDAASGRLRAARDRIATELGLEPAIVASRGVLDELARRIVVGDDPWAAPELRSWQAALLRPVAS